MAGLQTKSGDDDHLANSYGAMPIQELLRLSKMDLTPQARKCLESEISRRKMSGADMENSDDEFIPVADTHNGEKCGVGGVLALMLFIVGMQAISLVSLAFGSDFVIFSISIFILSVLSIYMLLKNRSPLSVYVAMMYWTSLALLSIYSLFMHRGDGKEVGIIIWSLIWIAYLGKSSRVRNTYFNTFTY